MKFNLLTILLIGASLIFTSSIFAQKQGKFVLIVTTPEAFVKIDTAQAEKLNGASAKPSSLLRGVHTYQIWASGFQLLTDTVTITADRLTRRAVNLKQTEAFQMYRKQMVRYSLDKGMATGSMVFLTAANVGLTSFVGWQGREQAAQNLEDLKRQKRVYEQAGNFVNLRLARENFNEAENKYAKSVNYYNRKLMIGVPLTLASYYLTYRVIKKIRKKVIKKPEFQDTSPLSNLDYQINPIYEFTSTNNFGLSLNIKF